MTRTWNQASLGRGFEPRTRLLFGAEKAVYKPRFLLVSCLFRGKNYL